VYVLRQNCRAAGWRWDSVLILIDSYKLYFDRTILTDIHIKHNRPDIIILNKQQKQAYLLDIAVPNSHNITQKLINI
jgi:hypothetical protein